MNFTNNEFVITAKQVGAGELYKYIGNTPHRELERILSNPKAANYICQETLCRIFEVALDYQPNPEKQVLIFKFLGEGLTHQRLDQSLIPIFQVQLNRLLKECPPARPFLGTVWKTLDPHVKWLTPELQEELLPEYLNRPNLLSELASEHDNIFKENRAERSLQLWGWLNRPLPQIQAWSENRKVIAQACRQNSHRTVATLCAICPALAKNASANQKSRLPLLEQLHQFGINKESPTAEQWRQLLQWPRAHNEHHWPFQQIGLSYAAAIDQRAGNAMQWPGLGETISLKHSNRKVIITQSTILEEDGNPIAIRLTEKITLLLKQAKSSDIVEKWLMDDGQTILSTYATIKAEIDPNTTIAEQRDATIRSALYRSCFGLNSPDELLLILGSLQRSALSEEVKQEIKQAAYVYENALRNLIKKRGKQGQTQINQSGLERLEQLKKLATLFPDYELAPDLLVHCI